MAYIKVSDLNIVERDLSSGTESFLTELQETDAKQIMGGGYAYAGAYDNGYSAGAAAGYGKACHGAGVYVYGNGEGDYHYGKYSYGYC